MSTGSDKHAKVKVTIEKSNVKSANKHDAAHLGVKSQSGQGVKKKRLMPVGMPTACGGITTTFYILLFDFILHILIKYVNVV